MAEEQCAAPRRNWSAKVHSRLVTGTASTLLLVLSFLGATLLAPANLQERPLPGLDQVASMKDRRLSDTSVSQKIGILDTGATKVELEMVDGDCSRVPGPFDGKPRVLPPSIGDLRFWEADVEHILCILHDGDTDAYQVKFRAIAPDQDKEGKFGFGLGVSIGLRPNIASTAVWPLQNGVTSLPLRIRSGVIFRTLALQTTVAGQVKEMPLVAVRQMAQWPAVVQFLDPMFGRCIPSSDSEHPSVVCRIDEENVQTNSSNMAFTDLLVLCSSCYHAINRRGSIGSWVRVEQAPSGAAVGPKQAPRSPWYGWSTNVPSGDEPVQWMIKASTLFNQTATFRTALVNGDDSVVWFPTPGELNNIVLVASALHRIASFMAVAAAATLMLSYVGLPAPTLAYLPAATSLVSALQFVVLLCKSPLSPMPLVVLCQPFACLAPADPFRAVSACLLFMLFVVVAHGFAVCHHILLNGNGSANTLPYSLYFGTWELRALRFIMLPLAAAAWTMLFEAQNTFRSEGWFSSLDAWKAIFAHGALGVALISFLFYFSHKSARNIKSWFSNEQVMSTKFPGNDNIIFVDRTCNQLRALPITPGRSRLLGNWPASPGWCYAPPVATTCELEHTCPPSSEEHLGYSILWPSGPWTTLSTRGESDGANGDDSSRFGNQQFPQHTQFVDSSQDRFAGQSSGSYSPLAAAHPIRVSTSFTYASKCAQALAGVLSIPWIDAAVPAGDGGLDRLDKLMAGRASIRCNITQLVGPLTAGRFSACFDWGTAWPFLWSSSIAVKLLLGAYLAAAPYMEGAASEQLLHAFLVLGLIGLSILAIALQPYVHAVDNIGLTISIFAAALAVILRRLVAAPAFAERGVIVLAVLIAVPLFIALVANVVILAFASRWQCLDMHERVLPRTVRGWATGPRVTSRPDTKSFKLLEQQDLGAGSWLWEDDCAAPSSAENSSTRVDILLTCLGSAGPPVALPAQIQRRFAHKRVSSLLAPSGAIAHFPDQNVRIELPVPAWYFFPQAYVRNDGPRMSADGRRTENVVPLAVLLTPDERRLIYEDASLNHGADWRQALRRLFTYHDGELAKEIETVVEESAIGPRTDGDRPFAIVEVVDPSR